MVSNRGSLNHLAMKRNMLQGSVKQLAKENKLLRDKLGAENAQRDLALIEYMSNDGHWQMLNGDSAESILAAFNATNPTTQTPKVE